VEDKTPVLFESGCKGAVIDEDTTGVALTCEAESPGGITVQTVIVKRDTTAPTAEATPDRESKVNGWYDSPVTVVFTGTDATSGVFSCADPIVLEEGLAQSATGSCVDNAGNVSDPASVNGVNIDMTDPLVGFNGLASSYLLSDPVKVDCTASDALSGVESLHCSGAVGYGYQFDHTASNSISTAATDYAGNTAHSSASFVVVVTREGIEFVINQYANDPKLARDLESELDKIAKSDRKNKTKGKTSKKLDGFKEAVAQAITAGELSDVDGQHLVALVEFLYSDTG